MLGHNMQRPSPIHHSVLQKILLGLKFKKYREELVPVRQSSHIPLNQTGHVQVKYSASNWYNMHSKPRALTNWNHKSEQVLHGPKHFARFYRTTITLWGVHLKGSTIFLNCKGSISTDLGPLTVVSHIIIEIHLQPHQLSRVGLGTKQRRGTLHVVFPGTNFNQRSSSIRYTYLRYLHLRIP